MATYGARCPQTLNDPIMILWWEIDEAMIILILIFVWFISSSWFTAILAYAVPYGYIKSKRKASKGFFKHLLYRVGLAKLDGYPSPFIKSFRE